MAKEIDGRAHINSGAVFYDKGDCSNDKLLVSCKQTKHASFSLTLKDLIEIEMQAKQKGKLPALFLEFLNSNKEYVILRKEDFLEW